MKQLKIILLTALVFFSIQKSNAQSNVAIVDIDVIMQDIPDMLDLQKQLDKLTASLRTEYLTMENEYQAKAKYYKSDIKDETTEETIMSRSKELEIMRKKIEDFVKNAETKLKNKEDELKKEIFDKIKMSVVKVGRKKGFIYVFYKSDMLLSDGPELTDLTSEVRKDLGF